MPVAHPRRSTRGPATLAILALAACGGGGTDPDGPPSKLEVVAGADQQAVVTNFLAVAPGVRVLDASGTALSGISVRFTVTSGGGTLTTDSVKTNASGVATVGSWKLGAALGTQTIRATAIGTNAGVTISATATAGAPAVLVPITPQASAALVGTAVPAPPTVEVRDGFGNPLPGVPVTFTVTFGGGAVTGAETVTNAQGRATVGSWTLGSAAGLNRLSARAGTNASMIFEAQGLGAGPATMAASSPTAQQGFLQSMVPRIPRVVVRDEFGNPSPGIPVTFTVVSGDGVITGGATSTGFDGVAAPADWRMGNSATSVVEATIGGGFVLPKVTFQANGTASAYRIDIRLMTQFVANDRDAFANAAFRWMQVITGDLPDRTITSPDPCGWVQTGPVSETVDDIVIFAFVETIDGPGGILAQGGSCVERFGPSFLPALGGMRFDAADMVNMAISGRLEPVILHEMGHVIGINHWTFGDKGMIADQGSADPIFTGLAAAAMWPTFGFSYAGRIVPLHNADGPGSADSHWRESILDAELMTPFVEAAGVPMPLSRITIAALQDLGYEVDFNKADPYMNNIRIPGADAARYPGFRLNEQFFPARYRVDASNRMSSVN